MTTASPYGRFAIDAEVGVAVADVAVELDERARVEQLLDPLAREQLPPLALPRDRLLAARVRAPRRGAPRSQARAWLRWCRASSAIGGSLTRGCAIDRRVEPPLDRSTIWPYDDGEPGAVLLRALRAPGRRRGRARARRARRRPGAALLVGHGRDDGARARAARARRDGRARRGRYYGTGVLLHRARALGAAARRVRPDRAAARRRRPRLARGAVEPVPDDARPRGGGRASGARRRATRPRRRRSTCGRSSTAATSSSTARRSTSAATTTCCSARSSAGAPSTQRGCASSAAAPGIVAAPDPAWLLLRGLETLRGPRRAPDARRAASSPRRLERARGRRRSSATRASAALLSFDVADGAAARRVETATRADRERDEPRRRHLDDRVAPPLGGRPRAGGAAAAVRRPRATSTRSGPTSSRRSPARSPTQDFRGSYARNESRSSSGSRSSSCSRGSTAATASTSASTRRRRCGGACARRMDGEKVETISALQDLLLHDPAVMERLLLDLSVNVTAMFRDPTLLPLPSARRSCLCCARIRSRGSGSPAARPARRSTRWRSCSPRRASPIASASTRPTSTTTVLETARLGVFPLDKMQEYTQNYIRAGGARSFSEYYVARHDGALLRARARRRRHLRAARPRLRRGLQRVQRHRLPERADLLRAAAPGARAPALLREPGAVRRPRAGQKETIRFSPHERSFEEVDAEERLFKKVSRRRGDRPRRAGAEGDGEAAERRA